MACRDEFRIRFKEALHGVAPGQVGAAWEGNWCLGCGEIVSTECSEQVQALEIER